MKTISVHYFAAVREALGVGSESVRTQAATVAALRAELMARNAACGAALAREQAVRIALNHEMCATEDAALRDGDELAFFPPVTGG
ncbi:MAG: molybdopterin converting factor subunit 1 [Burkholderiaceae bacterium]|jgi:molybdopterin synthase sulfur carrier subunit|nr:molybdopterin converting factor subunit 1 [Burkholderiaceae bacterium]